MVTLRFWRGIAKIVSIASATGHVGQPFLRQRGDMLESMLLILPLGFFVGRIARRLRLPALVGMVVVGIILGPQIGNVIGPGVLAAADSLRTIAVMVILMKAGLGLDREKLAQQGTMTLRLGFLPATGEANY